MAKALGINLQPDGFSFAVLEGGVKKFSVKSCGSGRLDPGAKDPARGLGKSLARALKQSGVGKPDHLVLSLPSLDTVLRELSLPFNDREKVHQVLKFEIESDLYHLDIEDVVCDFIEIEDDRATSTVLVAAEPKENIAVALDVLEEAGPEADTIELDVGALVSALDQVPPASEMGELEAFLYIGAYSSLLVVKSRESLRSVRAIRVGWREMARGLEDDLAALPEEDVASEEGAASEEAEASEEQDAAEGGDSDEDEEAAEHDSDERLFGADPSLPVGLDFDTVMSRASRDASAAMLRRLAAEVRRGLAAVASSPVVRLSLLGPQISGLDEALQARLGVPVQALDFGHTDDDGVVPDPVAFGAAMRGLGGTVSRMNLRQEEFRIARGLERVEGPLTWALVALIAVLMVDTVVKFRKYGAKRDDTVDLLVEAQKLVDKYLNEELTESHPKEWRVNTNFDGWRADDLDRLPALAGRVKLQRTRLDEIVGKAGVAMPQSCVNAWRAVFNVLNRELGEYNSYTGDRWMLEGMDLTAIDANEAKKTAAHVKVILTLTVFAPDQIAISNAIDSLRRAFNAQPWIMNELGPSSLDLSEVPGGRTTKLEILVLSEKTV